MQRQATTTAVNEQHSLNWHAAAGLPDATSPTCLGRPVVAHVQHCSITDLQHWARCLFCIARHLSQFALQRIMLVVCCCPQSWCGFSFAQPWRLVLLPVVRACVCSSPEGLGGAVHNCQNVMSKSHCRGGHCMLSNMRHGACRLSVEGRPQGDTTAEHAVLARVMPQQACSRCAVDTFTVNT